MPYPSSTLAYTDCYEAFDAALEHPKGVKVPCESSEAAERLRARMHYARKLHRESNATIYPEPDHPLHGRSPYDIITIRLEYNDKVWVRLEPTQSFAKVIEPITDEEDRPEQTPEPERVAPTQAPLPTSARFRRRV